MRIEHSEGQPIETGACFVRVFARFPPWGWNQTSPQGERDHSASLVVLVKLRSCDETVSWSVGKTASRNQLLLLNQNAVAERKKSCLL